MKRLFSFLCIWIGFYAFAGGFQWPNVKYDHAQLYYFNITLEKPSDVDFHIYHDSIYAASKVGNGQLLDESFLEKVHQKIARYSDPMRMGLSKCFFPRHGIIYYDKVGNPVASLSFCFECDGIRLWSAKPIRDIRPNSKHDWSNVEDEFAKLKKYFRNNDIIIFDQAEQYKEWLNSDQGFQMQGEITIENNSIDTFYVKRHGIEDVRAWNKNEYELLLTEEAKFTAGGEKWTYKQLNAPGGNSRFIFSFDDAHPYLVEATIYTTGIVLPNGVALGMSLDEVLNTIGVYDGPSNPQTIILKGKKVQLEYQFEHFSLQKIKMTVSLI